MTTKIVILETTFIDDIIFSIKLVIFIFAAMLLILAKKLFNFFSKQISRFLVIVFHKLLLWLVNIKIAKEGCIYKNKKTGVLFVSNHVSYIDIPVLGSLLSVKFIAKSEVSNWPLIGCFAKLADTIFIKRSKTDIYKQKILIQKHINNGDNVLLFPEATSSDGIRVLKFKSSLLSSVENKNLFIQPVVIYYENVNGLPLNRWLKPLIAWYGAMELKPHLLDLVKLFSISVKVKFLNPICAKDFKDRKSMTFFLHTAINNEYSQIINEKKV